MKKKRRTEQHHQHTYTAKPWSIQVWIRDGDVSKLAKYSNDKVYSVFDALARSFTATELNWTHHRQMPHEIVFARHFGNLRSRWTFCIRFTHSDSPKCQPKVRRHFNKWQQQPLPPPPKRDQNEVREKKTLEICLCLVNSIFSVRFGIHFVSYRQYRLHCVLCVSWTACGSCCCCCCDGVRRCSNSFESDGG